MIICYQSHRKLSGKVKLDECKRICSSFLETGIKPDQSSVDAAVKLLSDIMIETAQKSDLSLTAHCKLGPPVPRRAVCRTRVKPRAVQPEWHDDTCTSAQRKLQETARFLQRDPNNPWLRGQLYKDKKNIIQNCKNNNKANLCLKCLNN